MAESVLSKNVVQFYESWSKHLSLSRNILLPASGVEIDRYISFHWKSAKIILNLVWDN